jgi:FdhD protein
MENKMECIKQLQILHYNDKGKREAQVIVTKESSLTIIFNNHELVTLLCSPKHLVFLAVGFLFSEGLLKNRDEIKNINVDDQAGLVHIESQIKQSTQSLNKPLIASSGGKSGRATIPKFKIESQLQIAPHEVFTLAEEFQNYSKLFESTHGVHSAALCDHSQILVFHDDLGRHNAIDKIIGECILKDIPTNNRIIITTGRVPSEQLLKVAKKGIPIIVSLTVPTDFSVKLATDFGITLIGSARGNKMNVYTNGWRVVEHKAF